MVDMDMIKMALNDVNMTDGVRYSAVIDSNGAFIEGNIPGDTETLSILTGVMYNEAKNASLLLRKPGPDTVTIESDDRNIIAAEAGKDAILLLLTGPTVDMPYLEEIIGRASMKIKKAMGKDN
jgi:predicted regulator of Ras-like GTPase activity (Roadblock/LC7/MglB family)